MRSSSTRREFIAATACGLPLIGLAPALCLGGAEEANAAPVETLTIAAGDLKVVLRDNSHSPQILSGIGSLVNQADAQGFDAYDPDDKGASAGVNFEHVICGHKNTHSAFSPRSGKYSLVPAADGKSATLVRRKEDDAWALSSTLKYTVTAPHYIDIDFRCIPHDPARFGRRGYAVLFFANYMNDVADIALHFRGIDAAGEKEHWIAADAPKGPHDWDQGGTYRSRPADDLAYDADHNFKLNLWSYDYPRFTRPFYFGRAAHDMTLIQMFDKLHSEEDEIRFSLFKFKVPKVPRPAWDFQYVIRNLQAGKEYGFKARLVWKKFVSPEDCLKEYEAWAQVG